MSNNQECSIKEYTPEDFLKDLQKVCKPISKPDKQKTSSNKT